MQNVSAEFLEIFRHSHVRSVRLDVYSGSVPAMRGIKVASGSITADYKANLRRSLTCSVPLHAWEDVAIDVYQSRIQVWIGVDLGVSSANLLPAGVYRVNQISRENKSALQITASSLEAYVIDDRFIAPRQPPYGASTLSTIQQLITESIPDAEFVVTATTDKPVQATSPWERERWDAVTYLADSLNIEVFNGPDGKFVIRNKSTMTDPPVWRIDTGRTGVLVNNSISSSRDKVYNAVVVSGQSAGEDQPAVYAVAYNNDSVSQTYWSGPYGHVPKFYTSQFLTTTDQCDVVARQQLAEATAQNRTVDFTSLPNPALEPGDVVKLWMGDGTVENHMISSLSMPLGPGTWSAATVAQKAEEVVEGA